MSPEHDMSFDCMGCEVRLLVGPGPRPAAEAATAGRDWLRDFDAALSRFRPESELSLLNGDPRETVPSSGLLRTAARAGLWAAKRSEGIVDPTLVGELEAAGYRDSRAGATPASLVLALASGPRRHVAQAHPAARWRAVSVDDVAGTISRPPGVQLDTGGTGKGLAADAVAHLLRGHDRVLVDCGGDMSIGGPGADAEPYEVEVEHPLTGERTHTLRIGSGGVATSGLNVRLWERPGGSFAHHLLDPATGEPVWSGLIGVTALGPTALEAETLAKLALLTGPHGARSALAQHGGLVVHQDGDVELIGPLAERPRLRVSLPAEVAA